MTVQTDHRNALLSILFADDHRTVMGRGKLVDLIPGVDLATPGDAITHCWFPLSGVASVVAENSDGRRVEVGIIGYEGAVNGGVSVGSRHSPMRIVVQIAGSAVKVDASDVVDMANQSDIFRKVMAAYNHAFANHGAFSALANSQYSIEQRIARLALMCADRAGDDHIDLTHDTLADLLGVRRAGVTVALQALAQKGAMTSRRGARSIRDRALLLRIAGASYGGAEAEYRRMVTNAFPITEKNGLAWKANGQTEDSTLLYGTQARSTG